MLEILLSSRVRAKLITALFLSPGVERNAWDLAQTLGESYGAVWKELRRLEELGILLGEQKGNVKAYTVNPACPIEPELRSIVLKTDGVGNLLREKVSGLKNLHQAFLFGSFATGKADPMSDIDLMLIGEIDLEEISSTIAEMEKSLNRPINYMAFSNEEWAEKLERNEPFAVNVMGSPKIMLLGGENGV